MFDMNVNVYAHMSLANAEQVAFLHDARLFGYNTGRWAVSGSQNHRLDRPHKHIDPLLSQKTEDGRGPFVVWSVVPY
jgi:hypothetical protein